MVEGIPRLNQCYLCKAWHLEKDLHPIEVPDQAGYVQKLGCKECLDRITGELSPQDAPQQGKSGMEGGCEVRGMLFDSFICRRKLDEERGNPWICKSAYRLDALKNG